MARELTVVTALLLTLGAPPLPQALSKAEADSMGRKLQTMMELGEKTRPKTAPPLRTAFTEREVNAYFKHYGPAIMPPGVVDPQVTIRALERVAPVALHEDDHHVLAAQTGQELVGRHVGVRVDSHLALEAAPVGQTIRHGDHAVQRQRGLRLRRNRAAREDLDSRDQDGQPDRGENRQQSGCRRPLPVERRGKAERRGSQTGDQRSQENEGQDRVSHTT